MDSPGPTPERSVPLWVNGWNISSASPG
jgi:hypothetical protein